MAHKRMFSKDITGSDAFRDMPTSSQNLYFHLGMEADDDGFLGNYRSLMRAVGCGEDDLKILFSKRFLLVREEGVIVIKHWLINNTIRKDRYHETKYLEQKETLNIKENKAYTDNVLLGKPNGNQMATENRIEKDRIEGSPNGEVSSSLDGEAVTEVDIDGDGLEINKEVSPGNKADPKTRRVYDKFIARMKDEIDDPGIIQTYPQTAKVIKKALTVLSEKDCDDLMDWWFEESDKEPHDLSRHTQAFSTYNVNKYKTTYGK